MVITKPAPSTPGHPNIGWPLYDVSIAMTIVAGLFVMARAVARWYKTGLKVDDWMIIAALLSTIILAITEIAAVLNGYGQHSNTLTKEKMVVALKWFYAAQIFYKVVILFSKISIQCFYLRVFGVAKHFRWCCYVGIAFTALSGVAFIIVTIFQCTPVSGFWDKSFPSKCINNRAFWMSYAIVNITTDFAIWALPVHQVSRLALSIGQKVGIIAVFALGAFVCVISIIRATTLAASSRNHDATWGPIPATIWSVVECNTGIICACLPMFGPVLHWFFNLKRHISTSSRTLTFALSSKTRHIAAQALSPKSETPWARQEGERILTISTGKNPQLSASANDSEENMLVSMEMQGIMKTTNVSVQSITNSGSTPRPPG